MFKTARDLKRFVIHVLILLQCRDTNDWVKEAVGSHDRASSTRTKMEGKSDTGEHKRGLNSEEERE